jgi:hypothetical protein
MENSQTVFETRVFSKILFKGTQSRQSARLFSSRPNWDPPPPHTQASVSPPLVPGGRTLFRELWVGRGPNSDDGTDTLVLLV